MNLYKDAEKLIEDFFQNFEMHIAPKSTCDEVAVQRVKETLALYLEFTGDDAAKLDRSELESIFRAALTDFLYEVYFTLEDAVTPTNAGAGTGDDADDDWDEDLEEEDEDDEDDEESPFYEILSLGELCDLLREDPESHADCDCLTDKALEASEGDNTRLVVERLEALVDDLRSRKATPAIRKVLADGHLALGEVHAAAGDAARAIAAFKQAARVHGSLPVAHARIADEHAKRNDLASAIEAWREQIRLAPDDPEPYFACARAWESLGKPERAIETLGAMLEMDGANAFALDWLIRLSQEVGSVRDAQIHRERLLALPPPRRIEDIAVWVKYHLEAGDFEAVLEHLHKEELDTPDQSVLNLLKALVFLAKDDLDNVEVELLLFRDKLNGRADGLTDMLTDLERIFGVSRIDPLRRAIVEHVTGPAAG